MNQDQIKELKCELARVNAQLFPSQAHIAMELAVQCIEKLEQESAANLQRALVAEKDADRYQRLRGWMSSNVQEGWKQVEDLAAIGCYVDWQIFDYELDRMGVCNVGLMHKRAPDTSTQEVG